MHLSYLCYVVIEFFWYLYKEYKLFQVAMRVHSQYPALADRFSLAGRYKAVLSLVQLDEYIRSLPVHFKHLERSGWSSGVVSIALRTF
jgi:hypothetical protein